MTIAIFCVLHSCASDSVKMGRVPSSVGSGDTCYRSMAYLLSPSHRARQMMVEEDYLFKKNLLEPADLDDIEANSLFFREVLEKEEPELRQKSTQILALIKKQGPEMSDEAVISKYRLLFRFCGL